MHIQNSQKILLQRTFKVPNFLHTNFLGRATATTQIRKMDRDENDIANVVVDLVTGQKGKGYLTPA